MPAKYYTFNWKHLNEKKEIVNRGKICIDTFEDRYNPDLLKKAVIDVNGFNPSANIILEEVRCVTAAEF